LVEATYTVKSMAKPKRGRSTAAIDNHVGGRIRERRIMLGLTQQQLAEMIGVTYQQAHKYERGINRVSAGRLFEIARALSAPITYFYEGLGEKVRGKSCRTSVCSSGSPATLAKSGTRSIKRR
jgi:DNA-binding XRE family transcriptional regulator